MVVGGWELWLKDKRLVDTALDSWDNVVASLLSTQPAVCDLNSVFHLFVENRVNPLNLIKALCIKQMLKLLFCKTKFIFLTQKIIIMLSVISYDIK